MTYRCINNFDETVCRSAAGIHAEALAGDSFITLFGQDFLLEIYHVILENGLGFLIYGSEENRPVGFVLGLTDSTKLMPLVRAHWPRFLPRMIRPIFFRPSLLGKIFQILRYGNKTDIGVLPELLVITVGDGYRGRGVGGQLVAHLEEEFRRRGINQYKVTVHEGMNGANRFYQHNQMTLSKVFRLNGLNWNLYIKHL